MSIQKGLEFRIGTISWFRGNASLLYFAACLIIGLCGCSGTTSSSQASAPPPGTDVRLVSVLNPDGPQPPPTAHAVSSVPRISSDGGFVSFLSAWNVSDTAVYRLLTLQSICANSAGCSFATTPVAHSTMDALDGGNAIVRQALSANGRYLLLAVSSIGTSGESGWAYVDDTCAGVVAGCSPEDYELVFDVYHGAAISSTGRFAAFGTAALILHDFCLDISESCIPGTLWRGDYAAGNVAIAEEGRFLVFDATSSTVVPNDNNDASDVFRVDTCVGAVIGCSPQTTRVSVAAGGGSANGDSQSPGVNADSRFVVFESNASNLVPGDTNGVADIFLADTCAGVPAGCVPQITRLSVSTGGIEANAASSGASISANGRFVAFTSQAANLVANDTNGMDDIFVRDTCLGTTACAPRTIRVSLAFDDREANADSTECAISADGNFVAYASKATNLVSTPTSGAGDIFLVKIDWAERRTPKLSTR